ncbi:MAG: hypothetical protein H7301_11315 [Cryobacterium sp.]|nr:hypothetical protein [Oligoflexia bacterium]
MANPSKSTPMNIPNDPTQSILKWIRLRSEDSAFVYTVLEASEGVCAYSTLEHRPGDRHRDIELIVPIGFISEVDRILADLVTQLEGECYVLPESPESKQNS